MSGKTPYLTLAGLAGAFVVLLAVNMSAAPGDSGESPGEYGGGGGTTSEQPENGADENEAENETETDENASDENESDASGTGFPREVVYAGHADDDGPAVAIAVLGDDAAAYFCDGVDVESWMDGKADDGELSLSGSQSAEIDARLQGKAVTGRVSVQDRTYRFSIGPAEPPAGLYRADVAGVDQTIGWIVLPDGSQVGISNAEGATEPAPELTPGSPVDVDGRSVDAQLVQGDADF